MCPASVHRRENAMKRRLPFLVAIALMVVSCERGESARDEAERAPGSGGAPNAAGDSALADSGAAAAATPEADATGGALGGAFGSGVSGAGGEASGTPTNGDAGSHSLETDDGSFATAPINDAAAIERYIAAFCDTLGACCEMASMPADLARCRGLFTSTGLDYDPAAGEVCLREQRAAAAEGTLCERPFSSEACARAWIQHGSKHPGEACMADADCAPSEQGPVACQSPDPVGRCQVQLRGSAGATPCVATVYPGYSSLREPAVGVTPTTAYLCYAADGLQCSTNHVCTPFGIVGDRCQWSDECDESSYCATNANPPQCAPRAPLGSRCESECAKGGWCNQLTHVCEPQRPANAACEGHQQCLSSICLNDRCVAGGWAYFCGGD